MVTWADYPATGIAQGKNKCMTNHDHVMRLPGIAFLACCLSYGPIKSLGQPAFKEVALAQGVVFAYGAGNPGGGVSCVDFDGDGKDDITLCAGNGKQMAFYRNTGSGFSVFPLLVSIDAESKHALWADFDNDGDKDLFVSVRNGRNYLYRNNGSMVMEDITQQAGLFMGVEPSYGAAWGDMDRDGWLDLIVTSRKIGVENLMTTNRLYRNLGDGTFEDLTVTAGLQDQDKSPYCVGFIDMDNDLWPDIYIAEDKRTINSLFINGHDGAFRDGAKEANADISMFGMSVSCADLDYNGTQEIYVTNTVGSKLLVSHGSAFTEESYARGVSFIGGYGWGASFLDADNDGDADLYVSGSLPGSHVVSSTFYLNDGAGQFSAEDAGFDADTLGSFSNATGDFNNDGFPDLLVSNGEPYPIQLWRNEGGTNHWVKIRLTGVLSNRDGIGSRVEVFTNGKRQTQYTHAGSSYLGQNSFDVHVGLGQAEHADSVCIFWPSGHLDTFYSVDANQVLSVQEGTSKPFIPRLNHQGQVGLCLGDSLALDAGLFGSELQWLWSTGETTPEIIVRQPGDYSVQVTSAALGINWSSLVVAIDYGVTVGPLVGIKVDSTTCYGDQDGAVQVNLSGGTPPYDVRWNSGATGTHLSGLSPGYYEATVEDDAGCITKRDVVINQPEPFLLEHTLFEISFGKFAIQLNRYGGVAPISYYWDFPNAPNSAIATNLDAGNYNVVAIDADGCMSAHAITIDEPATVVSTKDQLQIVLFPNPAMDALTVRLNQSDVCIQVKAVNSTARSTSWEFCPSGPERDFSIPVSQLFKGLNYIIVFRQGKEIHSEKIIVN